MKTVFKYETVSVALSQLAEKGYTKDYNSECEDLLSNSSDFTIDYLYRYEGASNPDDGSLCTVYETKTPMRKAFL